MTDDLLENSPDILPLLRGTAEGAECLGCPFSLNGAPSNPVFSEGPTKPKWILVGEGPGLTEVRVGRPFVGQSGQLVDKVLSSVGCKRNTIQINNSTLCIPPRDAPESERDRAAVSCRPRLLRELALHPGVPILTVGGVAARAVIPKEALDAIDPPEVPKSNRKKLKERQKAEAKALIRSLKKSEKAKEKREKAINKIAKKRLKSMLQYVWDNLKRETQRKQVKLKFDDLKKQVSDRDLATMEAKALNDALAQYELDEKESLLAAEHLAANPKPKKKKKGKGIKLGDIVGTCFDVDVDGTGTRAVIPAVHPSAIMRDGGVAIGGTHTPDLAFINLVYDASKVHALANGQDVRIYHNVETEFEDPERAWMLLRDIVWEAIEEGKFALDLETYVLDPDRHHALMQYVAKIKAIGIATSKRCVSILWDLIPEWAHSFLRLLLAKDNIHIWTHNGLYDRTVLAANGFETFNIFEDTMLGHHAAFPGNAHRLQMVTSQFYATSAWKSDFRNNEETPDSLTKYCAKDTGSTFALEAPIMAWVKRTKTEKIYALDKRMSKCASEMHLIGMPISREINTELIGTFSKNVKESRDAVESVAADPKWRQEVFHHLALQQAKGMRKKSGKRVADPEDFEARYKVRLNELQKDSTWKWKINAGKHVAALLQAMGVPLVQTTNSGQVSTKKDVLEGLVNIPLVRDLLIFRENDKLLTTFCLAPETRVLTADLRWVPIETLKVDDDLIGFDEHGRGKASARGPGARYQRSKVEALSKGVLNCYRITTDRGASVIASEDHLWLARNGTRRGSRRQWTKTCELASGDILAGFGDPWSEDQSWEGGFIAGFLEGEGCVLRRSACFTQNFGPALDHMMRLLTDKGFGLFVNKKTGKRNVNVYPHGGSVGAMRMLGQFRAPRLLEKASKLWEGHITGSASNPSSTILKIEKIGNHPVIALRTSTRTFIAEGLLTHNCWQMFDRFDSSGNPLNWGYADHNDRIHPIWSIHKISGRWASSEPVVSNVPKDKWKGVKLPDVPEGLDWQTGKKGFNAIDLEGRKWKKDDIGQVSRLVRPNLRSQIRAKLGRILIGFDFAQLEARLIALISGDSYLCSVFGREGSDIHTENARVVFPTFDSLPYEQQKKCRDETKTFSYACYYGANPETVWKQLLKEGRNVSLKSVAEAMSLLMTKMSGVVQWQRDVVRRASLPPYEIRDVLLGRRRVFPLGFMGRIEPTEAMNAEVQFSASAIMNMGMDRMMMRLVDRRYKEVDCCGQFHDAAIFEAYAEDADKIKVDIQDSFYQEHTRDGRTIRFPVDIRVDPSWAGV